MKDFLIAAGIVFLVVVFFSTNAATPEQKVLEVMAKFCILLLIFVSAIALGCMMSSCQTNFKSIFLAFIGAFVFVCVWRSTAEPFANWVVTQFGGQPIFPQYQPYPWGTSVKEIAEPEARFGTKRDEVIYPEINITEKPRSYNYITEIDDTSSNRDADFPMGANN